MIHSQIVPCVVFSGLVKSRDEKELLCQWVKWFFFYNCLSEFVCFLSDDEAKQSPRQNESDFFFDKNQKAKKKEECLCSSFGVWFFFWVFASLGSCSIKMSPFFFVLPRAYVRQFSRVLA